MLLVSVNFNGERREYIGIQVNGFGPKVNRLEIAFEDLTIISLPWEKIEQIRVASYERPPEPADEQPGLFDDEYVEGIEEAAREALEGET